MIESEQHEMQLIATHESGAEEWHCPACGRRFLMQWPPQYKKIVLVPGDEQAFHKGGKNGLSISATSISQSGQFSGTQDWPAKVNKSKTAARAEEGLRPWLNWLREARLDDDIDNPL